jgi:D-lyxose ketol-isomerase
MKTEVERRMTDRHAIDPAKQVTPMLRVRVVDIMSRMGGTLSIWRPNEDLVQGLKEKSIMKVMNASVGIFRSSEVSLKSSKQTRFQVECPKNYRIYQKKKNLEFFEKWL